jgi:hypothetical protein
MSIVWILVGAFIGWSFPQPLWAKMLQEKVLEFVKNLFSKPQQ